MSKKPKIKYVSDCCGAELLPQCADEGTCHAHFSKCGKDCNWKPCEIKSEKSISEKQVDKDIEELEKNSEEIKNLGREIKPEESEKWEEELNNLEITEPDGKIIRKCLFKELYPPAQQIIKSFLRLKKSEWEKAERERVDKENYNQEKQEQLSCPFCNLNTHYSGSPEYFDQWKIKHQYHKNL